MGEAVGGMGTGEGAASLDGLAVTSAYGGLVGGAQQSPTNDDTADGLSRGATEGAPVAGIEL